MNTNTQVDEFMANLEGDAREVRVARFHNMKDIEEKEEALRAVVREWIRLRDDG